MWLSCNSCNSPGGDQFWKCSLHYMLNFWSHWWPVSCNFKPCFVSLGSYGTLSNVLKTYLLHWLMKMMGGYLFCRGQQMNYCCKMAQHWSHHLAYHQDRQSPCCFLILRDQHYNPDRHLYCCLVPFEHPLLIPYALPSRQTLRHPDFLEQKMKMRELHHNHCLLCDQPQREVLSAG